MNNELQQYESGNVQVVEREVGLLADDSIVALAEQAEKRLNAINKIMTYALKVTTVHDWCIIGGKPYLQESGASKVARLFGVSWQVDEPKKEVRGDGHYSYSYHGKFSLSGASIEADGVRASYDEFFTGKGDKKKQPDEIDVRDVKIAAYTNCINNGIKRILPGLRNITVETLKAAGLDTSKINGYGFNTGAGKEESGESADKRAEIKRMLFEASGGDMGVASKMLAKHTAFTGKDGNEVAGKTDVSQLSEKAIGVTYGKIKKAYDEWKAKQPTNGDAGENGGGDEE